MGTIGIVLISVAAVAAASAFVYGFFRRATRVSWAGAQIALLFGLTLLLDLIEPPAESDLYIWLVVGLFGVALAGEFLFDALLRKFLYGRLRPKQKGGAVVCGRIFGGLISVVNVAVFLAAVLGLALGVIDALPSPPELFTEVLESGVWRNFFAEHFYDLFFVAVCFLFVRAGLKLGVLRGIYYLLMFALTFAGAVGAYLLATQVGVFEGWGAALAGKFGSLSPATATVLGHGIIALAWFIVIFAVISVIGFLLHWIIRKLLNCAPLGIVASVLLGILFFAIFLAVTFALDYGVAYLAAQAGGDLEALGPYAEGAVAFFTSSPLSSAFYLYNPFLSLLGL